MIARPTLEVNIVRHCINKCLCCSHASPWSKPYLMPPDVLEQDLASLSQFMHVRSFFLLGGEPLLHPQLLDLLDVANASPIADETCVLTNGQLLRNMPLEFWTKFDFLRISAYPSKFTKEDEAFARGYAKQFGFGVGVDWMSTFWLQFEKSDGSHFMQCPWRERCLTVHDGYLFLCPAAAFFPDTFLGLPFGTDGLSLNDLTEEKLSAYLDRKEPFRTCCDCHSFVRQVDWRECHNREQWMKDSSI